MGFVVFLGMFAVRDLPAPKWVAIALLVIIGVYATWAIWDRDRVIHPRDLA